MNTYEEFDDIFSTPRSIHLSLLLLGKGLGPGDWQFLTIFNGQIIIDTKWHEDLEFNPELLLDLNQLSDQSLLADQPLIFLIRAIGGKGAKDPDPLLHVDNRAGASVDLFPLVLGEKQLFVEVHLNNLNTGIKADCVVNVSAITEGEYVRSRIPLTITMISAHCLPQLREGTVLVSAIGLNDILERPAVNFGMSLSNRDAKNIVWASASSGGLVANTPLSIFNEDVFVPPGLPLNEESSCNSFYWNAMKRVLVDSTILRKRLFSPFLMDIAGVPRAGKTEVRGRYMAFVDAGVLLEPGELGVTVCAKLLYFNEANLPEGLQGLLELPSTSAKVSAREIDFIIDENGHSAYLKIRFDLFHPFTASAKIAILYDIIGFPTPKGSGIPIDELRGEILLQDSNIDVKDIKRECGALLVHEELSSMTAKGTPQGTQSVKRKAANRLILHLKYMLKQFRPDNCSSTSWHDVVTAHHAACCRAVNYSFAPQPPEPRPSPHITSARSRIAGDRRVAQYHIDQNLAAIPEQPRPLLAKVLRCLEEGNNIEARNYLLKALSIQTNNRYLLWILGGIEYNKDQFGEIAEAAFRIAAKGDSSDAITSTIGRAALHALYHDKGNPYASFVAARKMRKSFELSREWNKFYQRWLDISGEEETFWLPSSIDTKNSFLIAASFFLCLRCYDFSERLLKCVEEGCMTRGSRFNIKMDVTVDVSYLRAASQILRQRVNSALDLVEKGINKFGPSSMMSQIHAICLACTEQWDKLCEKALVETDRAGAKPCAFILLRGALGILKNNPKIALQRAARAHQVAPSAHSALTIGRAYALLGDEKLAERWAAAAVNTEPLLSNGWAFLAVLALYERKIEKAKVMLRTAKQAGPVSPDIEEDLKKIMKIVQVTVLPDAIVKDLCFCEYF